MTDATQNVLAFARRWQDGQTTLDPAHVEHVMIAQALRSVIELADARGEESRRAEEHLRELHAVHEKRQITIAAVLDEIVVRLRGQPRDADALDTLAKIAKEIRLQAEDQLGTPRID